MNPPENNQKPIDQRIAESDADQAEIETDAGISVELTPKVKKAMSLLASFRQLEKIAEHSDGMPNYIGRYRIVESVGRGGFSEVFRAIDEDLSRDVALKIPLIVGRDDCQLRFEREAKLAAMLSHRQIVPVYEFGCVGKIDFIAYAWIEGITLGEWLRDQGGKVSGKLAAEIVAGLARAMHYAHERGVVHRDLKPSNVLVDQSTETAEQPIHLRTKITDLGLSRDIFDDDLRLTQTGQTIGTPGYMSPEQARGDTDIAVGTDIYSLGVVLFEMLTGKLPFERDNAIETLKAINETPAPLVTELNSGVSKELAAIVDACLQKDLGNRYRTAFDLAEDLDAFLTGRSVSVRTAGPIQRVARWAARNRYLCWTLALVTLSLSAGLVASIWQRNLATSQAIRAEGHLENTALAIDILLNEINDKGEPSLVTEGQREVLAQVLELQERLLDDPDFHKFSRSRVNTLYRASRINQALGQFDQSVSMLSTATEMELRDSDFKDREFVETMLQFFSDGIRSLVLTNRGEEAIGVVNEMDDFFVLSSDLFDEVETKGYELVIETLRAEAYFNAGNEAESAICCRRSKVLAVWLIDSGNTQKHRRDMATSLRRSVIRQHRLQEPEFAVVTYDTAIDLLEEELIDHPNSNPVKNDLAVMYMHSSHFNHTTLNEIEKAERQAKIAIEILEGLTADAPKNPTYVLRLADAYSTLAIQYWRNENSTIESALNLVEKGLELEQKGLLDSLSGKSSLVRMYRTKSRLLEADRDLENALDAAKTGVEFADLYFSEVKGRTGLPERSDVWIQHMNLAFELNQGELFFRNCSKYLAVLDYELSSGVIRSDFLTEAKAVHLRHVACLQAAEGRFEEAVQTLELYANEPWHYYPSNPSNIGQRRFIDSANTMCKILKMWQASEQETGEPYDDAVTLTIGWLKQRADGRKLKRPKMFDHDVWSPIRRDPRFEKILEDANSQ